MTPDSVIALREFVDSFGQIHRENKAEARVMLVSAFVTCFGIMSPDDRIRTTEAFLAIAKDINIELFEDGQDFISFLMDKSIENKEAIKRLEAEGGGG
jgi:hypothetical protein